MHDEDGFFAIFVRIGAEPGLAARRISGILDRTQPIDLKSKQSVRLVRTLGKVEDGLKRQQ